eukprot:16183-Heterococcus_DN1.PRE.1
MLARQIACIVLVLSGASAAAAAAPKDNQQQYFVEAAGDRSLTFGHDIFTAPITAAPTSAP